MKTNIFQAALLAALASGLPAAEIAIKSGERIEIRISGVQEADMAQINRTYTISDTGTINLAYIKEVKVAGLKPSALQKHIERAYIDADIFQKPVIQVETNVELTKRFVFVISGCNRNGPVEYTPNLTIFKAISAAGSWSPFANKSQTTVVREGQKIPLDLSVHSSQTDIPLLPEDQIIIKE